MQHWLEVLARVLIKVLLGCYVGNRKLFGGGRMGRMVVYEQDDFALDDLPIGVNYTCECSLGPRVTSNDDLFREIGNWLALAVR